jgi:hypothetical protein
MQRYVLRLMAVVVLLALAALVQAGSWTTNNFFYKPAIGARGQEEYNKFNTGVDRLDARLGKEIFLGDPNYGPTLTEALTAIGNNKVTLTIPAGTVPVTADTTIPANVHLKVLQNGVFQVADGVRLIIQGPLEAGPYQIFSWTGSGAVFLRGNVKEVLAEWFYPEGVTDHTDYLKKAVLATKQFDTYESGKDYWRPPVILTKPSYTIANLTFGGGWQGDYYAVSLIGRVSNHRGAPVLWVKAGSGNNGIVVGDGTNFQDNNLFENLRIQKVGGYPGDNTGDVGLKFVRSQNNICRNIQIHQFGGAALQISRSYFNRFEHFQIQDCYRGIEFKNDGGWCVTSTTFTGFNIFAKVPLEAVEDGLAQAQFIGLTTDDNSFSVDSYIKIDYKDKQFNFLGCWFEGLGADNYAVTIGPHSSHPYWNQLIFSDNCKISLKNKGYLVNAASGAYGQVTLKNANVYESDLGVALWYEHTIISPNYQTSAGAQKKLWEVTHDLSSGDGPQMVASTPLASGTFSTYGPGRGIAFLNGTTVSAFNGTVNHRFKDDSKGIGDDLNIDGFRSSIKGLWTTQLRLQQSDIYGGGADGGLRIVAVEGAPTATTANVSTTDPYKVTNIVSGVGQFSAGDQVKITGAGPGGADLYTTIIHLLADGSGVLIKDPVQTSKTGTGFSLVGTKGDLRLYRNPSETGSTGSKYCVHGWRCLGSGTPGTWVQMRMLTGN